MLLAFVTVPSLVTLVLLWLLLTESGLPQQMQAWQVAVLVPGFRYALKRLAPALSRRAARSVFEDSGLYGRGSAGAAQRHQVLLGFRLLYLDLWALAVACLVLLAPAVLPAPLRPVCVFAVCMLAGMWAKWDGLPSWFRRFMPAWCLVCGLLATACLSACVHPGLNPLWSVSGVPAVHLGVVAALLLLELSFLRQARHERVLEILNVFQVMLLLRPALGAPQLLLAAAAWLDVSNLSRPKTPACECEHPAEACGPQCVWHHVIVQHRVTRTVILAPPLPQTSDGLQVRVSLAWSVPASAPWLQSIEDQSRVRWVDRNGVPFLALRPGVQPEQLRPQRFSQATWESHSCSRYMASYDYHNPPRLGEALPNFVRLARQYRRELQTWEPHKFLVFCTFWLYKVLLLTFGDPTGWAWALSLLPLAAYAAWMDRKLPQRWRGVAGMCADVRYLWMHPFNSTALPAARAVPRGPAGCIPTPGRSALNPSCRAHARAEERKGKR
jgi:hypothetical protein